jgi:hypothetical protein
MWACLLFVMLVILYYTRCLLLLGILITRIVYTKFEIEDIRSENKSVITIRALLFFNRFSKEFLIYYKTITVPVDVYWERIVEKLSYVP